MEFVFVQLSIDSFVDQRFSIGQTTLLFNFGLWGTIPLNVELPVRVFKILRTIQLTKCKNPLYVAVKRVL